LVPSSGSTTQKRDAQGGKPSASTSSSEAIGIPGAASVSIVTMIRSAARSAAVTGVLSVFC